MFSLPKVIKAHQQNLRRVPIQREEEVKRWRNTGPCDSVWIPDPVVPEASKNQINLEHFQHVNPKLSPNFFFFFF